MAVLGDYGGNKVEGARPVRTLYRRDIGNLRRGDLNIASLSKWWWFHWGYTLLKLIKLCAFRLEVPKQGRSAFWKTFGNAGNIFSSHNCGKK